MNWRPDARLWRTLRRVAFTAFIVAVAALFVQHAREVDWATVGESLSGYSGTVLAAATAMAFVSHLLYASFDLMGRAFVGHGLAVGRTLAIAAVSYAVTLNLGALVGGVGFRFRLYSRFGLRPSEVARVIAFSVTTNWSGQMLLLGSMLALDLVAIPEAWGPGALASRLLGGALLAVVAGYIVLCAYMPRRKLTVRGRGIRIPDLRFALSQIVSSSLNWTLVGALLYVLLGGQAAFPDVLGAVLLSAIAGALAHIPAGLGVLETVFVLLLSGSVSSPEIIAALLVYRAVFYLAPLLVAVAMYATLEFKAEPQGEPAR